MHSVANVVVVDYRKYAVYSDAKHRHWFTMGRDLDFDTERGMLVGRSTGIYFEVLLRTYAHFL